MGDEEKLKIIIEAQNKAKAAFDEAQKQIDDTEKKFSSMGDKMQAAGDKMKSVSKKMTTYMTLPILAGAGMSIKAFSDLQETMNKVEVSFGSSSDSVKKWSKTSIEKMGLAQQSALDSAALFGDMGTGMGQNQKDAAKMGMGLTQLGADLASFKNVSNDRAKTALAGIYTGETEALKGLGIVMTETNLQEYAASKGIKKKLSDMTQQEKVQLRYNYVMDKTKNAQGDFARTSDSLANKTRTAKEKTKQLSAELGGKLAPVYQKLLEVGTKVLNWFGKLSDGQKDLIVKAVMVAAAIGPVVRVMGSLTKAITGTYKAGQKGVEVTKSLAGWVSKHGKSTLETVKFQAQYRAMQIKENALKAAGKVKTVALTVAEKARTVATKIGAAAQAAFNAVMSANPVVLVVAAIIALVAIMVVLYKKNKTVRDFIDKTWRAISNTFMSVYNTIKDVFLAVFDWLRSNWQLVVGIIAGPIGWIILLFTRYKDQTMAVFKAVWEVIKWAFNGIVAVIKWAWENVIKPAWNAIVDFVSNILIPGFQLLWAGVQVVWNGIVTVITWAWNNVIKPLWDLLYAYVTTILIPMWSKIWSAVQLVWNGIVTVIQWAWNNVIKPIWDLIWAYITNVLVPVWQKIWDVAKAVFEGVWSAIQAAWAFIQPIFQAIWDYITNTLVPIFQAIWDKVKSVFTSVWDKISTVISNIKDGFNKVKEFITGLIDKFNGIKDKVGDAFSGIVDMIKGPFKTVFNWIADGWNKTLGKLSFTVPDIPGMPGRGKTFSMPQIDKLYKGVRNFGGGAAVVGDINGRGGEIVNMPGGTDVYNNRESKRIMRAIADGNFTPDGRGGGTVNTFTGNIYLMNAEAVKEFFKQLDRQGELASMGVPA